MSEKNTFKLSEKLVCTEKRNPTNKDLKVLNSLGFDLRDLNTYSQAWLEALYREDVMKQICNTVFEDFNFPEEEALPDDFAAPEVYEGLKVFFGKFGIRMI